MRFLTLHLCILSLAWAPAPLPRATTPTTVYSINEQVVALVPWFGPPDAPTWVNCRVVGKVGRDYLVEHLHDFDYPPRRWVVGAMELRKRGR